MCVIMDVQKYETEPVTEYLNYLYRMNALFSVRKRL